MKIGSYDMIVEPDADGFLVATVPALRGCHTQAKTFEELKDRIEEVINLCLEAD